MHCSGAENDQRDGEPIDIAHGDSSWPNGEPQDNTANFMLQWARSLPDRVSPPEAREPGEIAVVGMKLRLGFDG